MAVSAQFSQTKIERERERETERERENENTVISLWPFLRDNTERESMGIIKTAPIL